MKPYPISPKTQLRSQARVRVLRVAGLVIGSLVLAAAATKAVKPPTLLVVTGLGTKINSAVYPPVAGAVLANYSIEYSQASTRGDALSVHTFIPYLKVSPTSDLEFLGDAIKSLSLLVCRGSAPQLAKPVSSSSPQIICGAGGPAPSRIAETQYLEYIYGKGYSEIIARFNISDTSLTRLARGERLYLLLTADFDRTIEPMSVRTGLRATGIGVKVTGASRRITIRMSSALLPWISIAGP